MRWLNQIDTSQCKNIVSVDHPNCESSQREPDQTKSQFSFWNWRIVFVLGHLSALNFFCYNLNLQFTRSRWYLSSPEPDRPNMSDCFSSYSAHENKTKMLFTAILTLRGIKLWKHKKKQNSNAHGDESNRKRKIYDQKVAHFGLSGWNIWCKKFVTVALICIQLRVKPSTHIGGKQNWIWSVAKMLCKSTARCRKTFYADEPKKTTDSALN